LTGDSEDPQAAAVRIESLLAELGASGDARVRAAAEDLVRQLMQLYGAGLARMMDLIFEQDEAAAAALFDRFADDPLVASLMALHGLHPQSVEARIARALDRVRPVVSAAGADLTVLAVSDDSIRLRLDTQPGVPSPAANVRPIVERVIAEAAPEIERIVFEGGAAPLPLLQITRSDGLPARASRRSMVGDGLQAVPDGPV
jgi:hypothetical protein